MATKNNIVIVATVVKVNEYEGVNGKFNKLIVFAGETNHWDNIGAHSKADKTVAAVFAKAKTGDVVRFTDCFLNTFVSSSGKACVDILAKHAEFIK